MNRQTEYLKSVTAGLSYNVLLQLSIRVLSFLINGVSLRLLSRDAMGIFSVRLLLLYSTTLFLSREAFRKALVGGEAMSSSSFVHSHNAAWLSVPLGLLLSLPLGYIWMYILPRPQEDVPYNASVCLILLCVVLELLSEPLFIASQQSLQFRLRVVAEGSSQVLKAVTTITLLLLAPHLGILALVLSQVVYSLSLLVIYYLYFMQRILSRQESHFPTIRSLLPQFPTSNRSFTSPSILVIVQAFFYQGISKQFLTEAERYLMTIFTSISFSDQGVFDIVNNLGSLVARFLLQPLEESFYLFFSKLLPRDSEINNDNLKFASLTLKSLITFVSLVGLTIAVFGQTYSYLALHLYGGSTASGPPGPTLLRLYCVYILTMCINGISESFFMAAATKSQLDNFNRLMFTFSIVFVISAWVFTSYFGTSGLLLSNCLSMGMRIVHHLLFISKYFKNDSGNSMRSPLSQLIPPLPVMGWLVLSWLITSYSETVFLVRPGDKGVRVIDMGLHVLVGAICLALHLVLLWLTNRELIRNLSNLWKGRHQD